MASYTDPPEEGRGRRDLTVAGFFLVLSVILLYLPTGVQSQVSAVLQATALALKSFPLMNSSLEGEQILQKKYINLGVAVAMESGLIVPVIKAADEKNLLGLARAAAELAEKAKNKKLMPEDVQGGTFTVTNPGVYGNIFGLPIINQPQLGILGVGAIKKRPVVVNDAIAIRSIMYISLSYDHRVIDGSVSAQFVQKVRSNLENYDTENAI